MRIVSHAQERHDGPSMPKEIPLDSVADLWWMFGEYDETYLRTRIAYLSEREAYERSYLVRQFVGLLVDTSTCTTARYEWKTGSHYLNIRAGRAAVALGCLLGTNIPLIARDATSNDLQKVAESVAKAVRDYDVKLREAAQKNDRQMDDLTKEYRGTITPGIVKGRAVKSAKRMAKLFREWFPVGKRFADLEDIVGVKARGTGNIRTYDFDMGMLTIQFTVIVNESGMIEGVLRSAKD